MSVELATTLVLRDSIPTQCPSTKREGYLYDSSIVSATTEVLALNVIIYGAQDPLPSGSIAFVHGLLSEGTRGATANLTVFDGACAPRKEVERGDVLSVTGMVHSKGHRTIKDCIVVRVCSVSWKWFLAVSTAGFDPEVCKSLSTNDVVHVTGSFSGILHRSDASGRMIQMKPRMISFPDLHDRLPVFPHDEVADNNNPNSIDEVLETQGIQGSEGVVAELFSEDSDEEGYQTDDESEEEEAVAQILGNLEGAEHNIPLLPLAGGERYEDDVDFDSTDSESDDTASDHSSFEILTPRNTEGFETSQVCSNTSSGDMETEDESDWSEVTEVPVLTSPKSKRPSEEETSPRPLKRAHLTLY